MYKLKSILESLADRVAACEITIEEAAAELCKAGWTNYIDIEYTKRLLKITE